MTDNLPKRGGIHAPNNDVVPRRLFPRTNPNPARRASIYINRRPPEAYLPPELWGDLWRAL